MTKNATRRLPAATATALAAALALPGAALAAAAPPAGGAAIDQVVVATLAAIVVTTALLVLGIGHRSGRVRALGRLAAFSERVSGLQPWVALPAAIATISLIGAVFGMYWDISLHIDQGRDEGPLANPAHYFILAGLFGIFGAGFVAMVLPREKPSTTAIRVGRDWHAPLGGVLICACGAFSLLGFPLDDVWHRIFGQDVTLWGPTHLMLLGGAAMTLLGIAVLMVEGDRANRAAGRRPGMTWVRFTRHVALAGAFLIALSIFHAEFDFGVPQFRLVWHPMLLMLASAAALVAARLWLGRGAALAAVAFYLLIRGGLALAVGPVLGQSTPYFALFIVEGALVELVALRVSRERPLAFGLACGAAIGTVGLAAEWAWSHLWMPVPWPLELLPEGALLGAGMALAGAVIGAWIGARLASDTLPRTAGLRNAASVAAVALAGMVIFALWTPTETSVTGSVRLEPIEAGQQRTAMATVTLDPRDAAADADWLQAIAWQGGGLVVDQLERIQPGVYRTAEPIPVHGDWKTMIRLHEGNQMVSLPVYLPEDPAIPAEGLAAPATFEREFVDDQAILQREKQPAATAVTIGAYAVVVLIALALLVLLVWALDRLARAAPGRPGQPRTRAAATPARTGRVGGPAEAAS